MPITVPSEFHNRIHRKPVLRIAAALALGFVALAVGNLPQPARALAQSAAPEDAPASISAPLGYIPYGCTASGTVIKCLDVFFASVLTRQGWLNLHMNIWLPRYRPGLDPLLIYIPGGGWLAGGRGDCPGEIAAGSNYAMACIEYRHSTDAPFPAQIYDVKRAVRWLRAHASYYGLDPTKFGAWGDSAGGHLAALLGTSGDVPELEGSIGYISTSSKVQAVVDWWGLTDFTQVQPAFDEPVSWPVPDEFWEKYHDRPWYIYTVATTLLLGGPVAQHLDLAHLANPVAWVDPTDPPFLIVHGEADNIVPIAQSQLLSDALGTNAVPVTLIRDWWRGHGPNDQGSLDWYGAKTIEQALAFFDQYLHGRR